MVLQRRVSVEVQAQEGGLQDAVVGSAVGVGYAMFEMDFAEMVAPMSLDQKLEEVRSGTIGDHSEIGVEAR